LQLPRLPLFWGFDHLRVNRKKFNRKEKIWERKNVKQNVIKVTKNEKKLILVKQKEEKMGQK